MFQKMGRFQQGVLKKSYMRPRFPSYLIQLLKANRIQGKLTKYNESHQGANQNDVKHQ